MPTSVSYRLDERLKERLASRARRDRITETALVSQLLEEGLKTLEHPGIVYRAGPTGRRAAIAGGPDVWEIVAAVSHAPGEGNGKISGAVDQTGVAEHLIRLAVVFAAAYPDEIQQRIADNEAAAEEARRMAEQRERLLIP